MKINEASNFFTDLVSKTSLKSEKKIYNEFIQILSNLKQREFSATEIQSIETKLDSLNLNSNPKNRKRFFRKSLRKFITYLHKTHSLVPKRYFTQLGIGLGMCFGTTLGVVFFHNWDLSSGIAIGICVGMAIGILVGRYLDGQAKEKGQVVTSTPTVSSL